ncbi:MAG: GUN4 domain-containing protein [Hormoscilla sp.]
MKLLELYLSPLDKTRFKVIVTQSPVAGGGETESSLPFSDAEDNRRGTLIKSLEFSSFEPRKFSKKGEQDWMVKAGFLAKDGKYFHPNYLANIGKALYQALFPKGSQVEQCLKSSIHKAQSESTQLVVRLKFIENVEGRARLIDYPWELVHDSQKFLSHYGVEFYRYIDYLGAVPNLSPLEKLHVLVVSSSAGDDRLGLKRLPGNRQNPQGELRSIRKGLETARNKGHISLEELPNPTFGELRKYLTDHPGNNAPHVLHFDGHGLFGKRCQHCQTMHSGTIPQQCRKCNAELPSPQGYLVFEDEDGNADYISAKELGNLLQQSSLSDGSSQTGGVVLVVLSACQSGMAIAGESVFNGVAQNLIAHQVPAVVAMQYSVKVGSATKFAEQFYRSLGQKNSLAVAVSQGRAAMGVEGNQWYRPVLYLRWQDNEGGQLFASRKCKINIVIFVILSLLIGILFPELPRIFPFVSKNIEKTESPLSEQNIKYRKLEKLLASRQFQEADEETWCLMLQAAGQTCPGFPPKDLIETVSCPDLLTIDKLWVKYSDGRFGFSIQNQIYRQLLANPKIEDQIWKDFAVRVGWQNGQIYFKNLKLASSPRGHLPWRAGQYQIQLLFDRVQGCNPRK